MKYSSYRKQIISILLLIFFLGPINYANGQGVDTANSKKVNIKLIDVAYGKQNPQAIGGAISTVNSNLFENSTATNIGNALYGLLPGLIVGQRGGEPGNNFSSLSIRGGSTYAGGTGPMVIVDGFQRDINQLPVEEIASISVLKDAASTAMYGIKAANGVILVTTRRGVEGQNRIGVTVKYGIRQAINLPKFINAADYASYTNEALKNDGLPIKYTTDDIQKFKDGTDPYLHPNVNWFDSLMRNVSPLTEVGFNFTGGNRVVRHYVMVNYMVDQGLFKNTDWNNGYNTQSSFKRLSFRSNVDINVTKRLFASLDIGGSMEDRNSPSGGVGSIFSNIYSYAPNLFPMRNPNGTLGGNSVYKGNPLGLLTGAGYAKSNDRNFQASFTLEHELDFIAKGLKIGGVVDFDAYQRASETYSKQFPVFQLSSINDSLIYTKFGQTTSLSRSAGNSQNNRTNFEGYLDYAQQFGLSEITAKLLYHQDKYIINWSSTNNIPYLLQGVSGRVAYGYNNKYFAEFAFGYNGTERFSQGKRFGFFPAGAISWLISEENFVKQLTWINYLKARASYGLVGNDDIGAGGDRNLYITYYLSSGSYPLGSSNSGVSNILESNYPNYDISWEKSYKTDLGIEGRLFNCLDLSLGYFHEKRTGIVDSRGNQVPSLLGISSGYVNYGQVSKNGFETTIQFSKTTGEFSYCFGVNGLFISSNIDKRLETKYPNDYEYTAGHPLNQPFGLEAIGFFKNQEEIDDPNTPKQMFGPVQPGDVRYKDENGDGVINSDDRVAIARPTAPAISYGINFGIKYKNVSLNGLLQGNAGYDMNILGYAGPMGKLAQMSEFMNKRWIPDQNNDKAKYPRLTTLTNSNNYQTSSLWYRSDDFIRLRNLELAYDLSPKALAMCHLSSCKIFIQGLNLLTISKIKIIDPEITSGYPGLKSYSVGLRLQF